MLEQVSLFEEWQSLDIPDASISYWPGWLNNEQCSDYWKAFQLLQWEQPRIRMYNREIPIPRLNAWYADSGVEYGYSGYKLLRNDWSKELLTLRKGVEQSVGCPFNSVLANFYRNGQDSVDWHADDEPELGTNPLIASVSLGATRVFQLKHKFNKAQKVASIELTPGSLLVMSGVTQSYWRHRIPKTTKQIDGRLNFTFRAIV